MTMDPLFDFRSDRASRNSKVVLCLEPEPKFGGYPEVLAQPQGGIGCNRTLPVHDSADPPWRYSDVPSQPIDADSHRLHELLEKDLPRRNGGKQFFIRHQTPLLVIVHDLHIVRITIFPDEAYPILIVDSNAMLPPAVPFQNFQPVSGRHPQVLQRPGAMEIQELPASAPLESSEPRHVPVGE